MFLSFTGCDTVLAFAGNGKKTAWAVWRVYPKMTESFSDLSVNTDTIGAENAAVIESIGQNNPACKHKLCQKRTVHTEGNVCTRKLASNKGNTQDHTKQAMYHGGHVCVPK